jgi:Glycine-rich domain-containing protein-like
MNSSSDATIISPEDITFSVDLVSAAINELTFLAEVDRCGVALTTDGPQLRRAVRRYEQCWMPLVVATSGTGSGRPPLAPPIDVEWIWHCHMLSPYAYESDSKRMTATTGCRSNDPISGGIVVDHRVMSSVERLAARNRTRPVWQAAYPGEPYDLELLQSATADASRRCSDVDNSVNSSFKSHCSYDLVAAVLRQSKFFYQVWNLKVWTQLASMRGFNTLSL